MNKKVKYGGFIILGACAVIIAGLYWFGIREPDYSKGEYDDGRGLGTVRLDITNDYMQPEIPTGVPAEDHEEYYEGHRQGFKEVADQEYLMVYEFRIENRFVPIDEYQVIECFRAPAFYTGLADGSNTAKKLLKDKAREFKSEFTDYRNYLEVSNSELEFFAKGEPAKEYIRIVGKIKNHSEVTWKNLSVEGRIYDAAGKLIEVAPPYGPCENLMTILPHGECDFEIVMDKRRQKEKYVKHEVLIKHWVVFSGSIE